MKGVRRKSMARELALSVTGCLVVGLFLFWVSASSKHDGPVSHDVPRNVKRRNAVPVVVPQPPVVAQAGAKG